MLRPMQKRIFIIVGIVFCLLYINFVWKTDRVSLNMKRDVPSTDDATAGLIANQQKARSKGRLFCWIMTAQSLHQERAIFVKDTWPPRCDEHFFFTDNNTGMDETRFLNVFQGLRDGYLELWPKTKAALQYIDKHFLNEYDWFLKADDDTYVIVENLRSFLSEYNLTGHHFSGYKIPKKLKHGYINGGAGYIMSRDTLKLLVQVLSNETICPGGKAEDLEVSRCLANVGVYPENTLDETRISRFIPSHPKHEWFQLLNITSKKVQERISKDVISIHQLSPKEYRLLDFFLYYVRRVAPEQ